MLDYEQLAREWVRALRGQRSQTAFSRRLGCRTNVVYTWEAGRRFPAASKGLWAAERVGLDVRSAVARFYRTPPDWLATSDLCEPAAVARLLEDLRGRTSIQELSERTGRSRFAVSRWLKGGAEPRLPDFFRLIEATTLRLLDFLSVFVDPAALPSVAAAWSELQSARRAAYELPWSHAVLRALELQSYQRLSKHVPGWIAARLSITPEQEAECLELLSSGGQIKLKAGRYVPAPASTVDTRLNPEAGKSLKQWWTQVALERLPRSSGLFSYNLFTVTEKDYQRLRELQLSYYRELRTIVAKSEPAERLVLANMHLLPLDENGPFDSPNKKP